MNAWEQMSTLESMTTREMQDMNASDANNSHFGARKRHALHPSQTNICFDHSNGWCARGATCRFSHDGPSGLSGKKCYHCNATGHLYKDCPDRSKFRDAPDLEAIDKELDRNAIRQSFEIMSNGEGPRGARTPSLLALWDAQQTKGPQRTFAGPGGNEL
eukprot:m.212990 g.212990  ORF g.212990 m.212990 type:complete len:159 (+) comp10757_c0_seq19:1876-2352(+)